MTRAILLLAAGASSRMRGRDKLLEEVDGKPLLSIMAERALAVGDTVLVALPGTDLNRRDALKHLSVCIVSVADPEKGLSASIKAGAAAAGPNCDLMILPADLPELTADDLKTAWTCFDKHDGQKIIRATDQDGTPGHPTIIPTTYIPMLTKLTGDQGAASQIGEAGFVACPLPNAHATTDLDTPEDWDVWRKKWGRT